MKIEFKWERMYEDQYCVTARAKVIGGWLIHPLTESPHKTICESMIFISDPNHEWEV